VERGDLRARAPRENLEQPEMIHVLMREHDQLELFDRAAVRSQRALQLVERLAGVGTRIEQRQRLVLDQVAVDATDEERSGEGQPVDACACG
jgi:hypothetical protein